MGAFGQFAPVVIEEEDGDDLNEEHVPVAQPKTNVRMSTSVANGDARPMVHQIYSGDGESHGQSEEPVWRLR